MSFRNIKYKVVCGSSIFKKNEISSRMAKQYFINDAFVSWRDTAIIKRNIDELDKTLNAYANKCDSFSLIFIIHFTNAVYKRDLYIFCNIKCYVLILNYFPFHYI